MTNETKYITIKDAANILGVTKLTLRNWDKSGKLRAHRHPFNNYRVYKLADIESVIELIEESPAQIEEKKSAVRKLTVQHLEENATEVPVQNPDEATPNTWAISNIYRVNKK